MSTLTGDEDRERGENRQLPSWPLHLCPGENKTVTRWVTKSRRSLRQKKMTILLKRFWFAVRKTCSSLFDASAHVCVRACACSSSVHACASVCVRAHHSNMLVRVHALPPVWGYCSCSLSSPCQGFARGCQIWRQRSTSRRRTQSWNWIGHEVIHRPVNKVVESSCM